jgi:hypothetical protein
MKMGISRAQPRITARNIKIAAEYAAGAQAHWLAKEYGLCKNTIYIICRKLGAMPRSTEEDPEPLAVEIYGPEAIAMQNEIHHNALQWKGIIYDNTSP